MNSIWQRPGPGRRIIDIKRRRRISTQEESVGNRSFQRAGGLKFGDREPRQILKQCSEVGNFLRESLSWQLFTGKGRTRRLAGDSLEGHWQPAQTPAKEDCLKHLYQGICPRSFQMIESQELTLFSFPTSPPHLNSDNTYLLKMDQVRGWQGHAPANGREPALLQASISIEERSYNTCPVWVQ